jgi:hypothetical protein
MELSIVADIELGAQLTEDGLSVYHGRFTSIAGVANVYSRVAACSRRQTLNDWKQISSRRGQCVGIKAGGREDGLA